MRRIHPAGLYEAVCRADTIDAHKNPQTSMLQLRRYLPAPRDVQIG